MSALPLSGMVVVVWRRRIELAVERLAWRRVHAARRRRRCGCRLFLDAVVDQIAHCRIEAVIGQRVPPDATTDFVLLQIRRRVIRSIPENASIDREREQQKIFQSSVSDPLSVMYVTQYPHKTTPRPDNEKLKTSTGNNQGGGSHRIGWCKRLRQSTKKGKSQSARKWHQIVFLKNNKNKINF